MALNIITAKFCSGSTQTWTEEAWQYDYGQVLQFDGLDLPDAYQVHFSNTPLTGETITQIGGADGVTVPDQFFTGGETIYAWVYLHEGEDDGETVYMVTIPVKKRPQPSDDVPTPVEQSAIDQAIAALNIAVEKAEDAIEHYPTIIDGTWHVWDVTEEEYVDTGVQAQGEQGDPGDPGDDGFSPEITVTDIAGGHRVTITDAEGTQSFDVLDGSGAPAFYGICNSSYGSLTKVVTCDGFELVEGARIIVTFTASSDTGITTGQLKLNVNSTGAKNIKYRNSITTFYSYSDRFCDYKTCEFVYDGTYYIVVGDFDTDTKYYQMTQSEADTGTSVTGRLISAKVLHNAIQNAGGGVTVDDELSTTSTNPVQNKVITGELNDVKADLSQLPSIEDSTKTGVDLDVSDEDGNVLMRLADGEVETKNFDSKSSAQVLTGSGIADLDVSDPEGNVVLRVKNGHIMTAKFTSEDVLARTTYITVKKDGTGDYATLRGAIEYINNEGDADPVEHPYVIQIYPGTYNLTDEYTQAEIETADVSDYHNGFVGWMLNDGMSLVGVGSRESIILSCVLDISIYNQQIRGNVSTLNTEGTVSLENLTVIAQNIRYCVHDDFVYTGTGQYYRYVKNCNFIGKSLAHSPACTWGGGMSGQGENALYENCDFGTDYGHHFDASKGVTITFRNCRGRKIRLAERSRAVFHNVNIEDSDFGMISLMRPSGVTAQHIMVRSTGCEKAFVSCYEDDIVMTGAITKTALTSLPVGTMVSIGTGSGNAYASTADKSIADGVVVANDTYYSYIQRTGYINTRVFGMSGFSLGDYITIDSNNKLVTGGTASNAVGQITFISQDSDASDQGIGFIKLFIGGKNNG